MPIVRFWNERVRRMNIFEVKLVQTAAICAALVIVKLVPAIMSISIWWFVALMIITAIRPLIVVSETVAINSKQECAAGRC